MRAIGCAALLTTACWLGGAPAWAATFVLVDGSTIVGTIIHGTRNTLTIRPTVGGLRQVPASRVERIEVTTADGRSVLVGRYRGWADGRSALEVGEELLWLEDERVVERQPLNAPVLATAPAPQPEASSGGAAEAVAGVPAAPDAVDSPPTSTVTAPLPPLGGRPAVEPAAGPPGERPVVSVKTSPADVSEKSGTIAFTVELSKPIDDLLVVIYSTVDGAAHAGTDYEAMQGILTLPAGVTSGELRTTVIDDEDREGDEEFQLFLASNPDLATVAEQWTEILIRDDD